VLKFKKCREIITGIQKVFKSKRKIKIFQKLSEENGKNRNPLLELLIPELFASRLNIYLR
jgi:hypothetical protein